MLLFFEHFLCHSTEFFFSGSFKKKGVLGFW